MFERLDLPPLVVVLLLLYGLLIAFIYTVWTALNLRRGRRTAAETANERQSVRSKEQELPKQPQPTTRVAPPAEAGPAKPWLARPAEAPRPADSEAVASYSVRKKAQTAKDPRPASAVTPAPHRQERAATDVQAPAARAPRAAASQAGAVKPTAAPAAPAVPAQVRQQEQPRNAAARPARKAETGKEERARNEDAFARFLRSSGEDRDDF